MPQLHPQAPLRKYGRAGERATRHGVAEAHLSSAQQLTLRFVDKGERRDDLLQVAMVGKVKAAERFDPDFGASFAAFATVTFRGELRRHLRDHCWAVHVPRRLLRARYDVPAGDDMPCGRLHRAATTTELAEYLAVTTADINDARHADDNFRSRSLGGPTGRGTSLVDRMATPAADDRAEHETSFESLLKNCPPRLRGVLRMRHLEGQVNHTGQYRPIPEAGTPDDRTLATP